MPWWKNRKPRPTKLSYSQNNEEEVILSYFGGRIGRFLDIGANDGVALSNTRALALLGWSGVLVEPCPEPFAKLSSLYPSGYGLVNAAIGGEEGEVEFYQNTNTLISTAIQDEMNRWGGGPGGNRDGFKPIRVRMMTVGGLLEKYPGPYDFVSIDCEGSDIRILSELVSLFSVKNPQNLTTTTFCVEHNSDPSKKATILSTLPYHRVILSNSENLILTPARTMNPQ